jgi:hypothetical protein
MMPLKKIVIRALFIGLACAIAGVALTFVAFAVPSVTLDRVSRTAALQGIVAENWIFGVSVDPYKGAGLRMLVNLLANACYYSVLVLLVSLAIRLFSSGISERRIAWGE